MLLDYKHLGLLFWALAAIGVLVSVFLLAPILFIVALSFGSSRWLAFPPPSWTFRWYREFFADPQWIVSLVTSSEIAAAVMVLSVILGLLASFALVRGRFAGRGLLRGFILMPMIMPVVILAVGLYGFYLRVNLNGTMIGFILAHLVIALPFAVIVITNSLASFDKSYEDAAIICGASPWEARLFVTIPSIRHGLVAAAIFSFLVSWDEVVMAIFMASPQLQTFPVRVWTMLRQDLTPVIAAASTLLIGLTTLLLFIGYKFQAKAKP
jgi:putative spermidine/putrescine transport system permease protein